MKKNLFSLSIAKQHTILGVLLFSLMSCKDSSVATIPTQPATDNWPAKFGFGRAASGKEIDSLNIDVRPDGQGLPAGEGHVQEGKAIYAAKCASCHGANGVEGPYNHLVATDTSKAKTIGNYWPYATTVFDYIKRAMPFNAPGSLTNNEVYHLTAYLLHANHLIDSTTVVNAQSLPKVVMPAKSLFVEDNRVETTEIR